MAGQAQTDLGLHKNVLKGVPMSETDQSKQYISLPAATAIVVASMVGTGVFTSLGFQLFGVPDGHGFPVMMLWVVGGIVALCGALSYAELTSMMPRSGGEYHLVGRAFHPLLGFLAGWVSITAGFSAPIALAAMAFGKYAVGIWPDFATYLNGAFLGKLGWALPTTGDKTMIAYAIVAVLTLLQLGGVRFITKFHTGLTVAKVLLIVGFVGAAWALSSQQMDLHVLQYKAGDQWQILNKDPWQILNKDFAISMYWVMFAYSGWNGAVYVAGEMRNPQRNLPLALILGTLIVMVLYIALNAVFLMGGKWGDMRGQEDVGLVAAHGLFSNSGALWMGALIAFGLMSTVNAMLWTGASTLKVIGSDMRALCWLDASDRRGEPIGSVLFMTNLVLLLLGTGTFESLLHYIQALLQLSALLCVVAVIWWRFRYPSRPRPFRVPLYPIPPVIFIVVSVLMLYHMVADKPKESAWGAATLLIGVIIYFASGTPLTIPDEAAEAGTLPVGPPANSPSTMPVPVSDPAISAGPTPETSAEPPH